MIGVAGLVFFSYTRSAMWLDEALTVNIARLPLSQLHDALKQDGAPPLYYLLLHFWTAVFGTGNVAARSLSGVFMAGAVVAMWFAARRFAGTTGAWIAAALTIASPYAIRYATEARMYSLVMLLVASGIVAFQRAMEKPSTGRLAVVAVLVALFVYTQYWSFYLLAVVVGVLVGVAWRGQQTRRGAARARRGRDRRPRVPAVGADVPLPARAHRNAVGFAGAARHPDRLHAARLRGRRERNRGRPPGRLAALLRPASRCCCSACSRAASTTAGSRSTCTCRARRA